MIFRVYKLLKPFFKGSKKWYARWVGFSILALAVADVALTYLFNEWRGKFYDAIQQLNFPEFTTQLLVFSVLAAISIVMYTMTNYLIQRYTLVWRAWQTDIFLKQYQKTEIDNPDQRIQEDVALFTDFVARLTLGLLTAALTLVVFTPILWSLSKEITFGSVYIPGSLWYISLLFSILGSWGCFWIGRKLWSTQYSNQKLEADFRYGLVKLREEVLHKEESSIRTTFTALLKNYVMLYNQFKIFGFARSTYFQAAIILPFFVAAPSYFSGAIQLGALMQIAHAFNVVNESMSYLLDRYLDITKLKSVTNRLIELSDELDK